MYIKTFSFLQAPINGLYEKTMYVTEASPCYQRVSRFRCSATDQRSDKRSNRK